MQETVCKFQKNATEEVRFTVVRYKGKDCVDIRCFILPLTGQGEAKPTRKGITLRIEQFPELRKGIERLGDALDKMGSTMKGTTTK